MGLKDKEKAEAKRLFVIEKLTAKEISTRVGVSQATLSKWVVNENWRGIKNMSPAQAEQNLNKPVFESVNAVKVLTSFSKYLEVDNPELSQSVNNQIYPFILKEFSMA